MKAKDPDYSTIPNLDLEAWADYLAYRREEGFRKLKSTSVAKALAKHPKDVQRRAVDQTMAKGWQGLFPEKIHATNQPAKVTRYEQNTQQLRDWLTDEIGVNA